MEPEGASDYGLRLARVLNEALDPECASIGLASSGSGDPARADVTDMAGRPVLRNVTREEAVGQLPPGLYIFGRTKIAVR